MKPLKHKKCRYSQCDKYFFPFRSTQVTCFNPKCSLGYNREKQAKQTQRIGKELANPPQDNKPKVKKLSEHEADARKQFQIWVRLRDNLRPCISCNVVFTKLWDGGHYFKAELYSGLIFTEENCHKQCRKCNRYLHGNESAYRIGLVNRYGEDYVKRLEDLSLSNRSKKWTREEYLEIESYYKLKIKQLIYERRK